MIVMPLKNNKEQNSSASLLSTSIVKETCSYKRDAKVENFQAFIYEYLKSKNLCIFFHSEKWATNIKHSKYSPFWRLISSEAILECLTKHSIYSNVLVHAPILWSINECKKQIQTFKSYDQLWNYPYNTDSY